MNKWRKCPLKIIACCILHNICLEVIDVVSDGNGFFRVPLPGHDINANGARLRNIIKDNLYRSFNLWHFSAKIASFSFQFSHFKQKKLSFWYFLFHCYHVCNNKKMVKMKISN